MQNTRKIGVPANPPPFTHRKDNFPPVTLLNRSMTLDLESLQSVRRFVAEYKDTGLPLHVLVGWDFVMLMRVGSTG